MNSLGFVVIFIALLLAAAIDSAAKVQESRMEAAAAKEAAEFWLLHQQADSCSYNTEEVLDCPE